MIITIVLGLLCYLNWKIKDNRKFYYVIATVVLMIYAYFVIPERGMDLYTHYTMLRSFRTYGLESTVLRYPWLFKTLPLYSGYFYLISKIGFDQALLIITYGLIYGGQFGIVRMICKDTNATIKEEQTAATLVLLLTNAYFITSIRNVTAFIVVAYALYIDVVRKRHRLVCCVVYLLLCLFHDSVVLIVVMRVMLLFVKKKYFRPVLISVALWPLIITWVIDALNGLGIPYLSEVASKLAAYSEEGANAMWVGGIANRIMVILQSLFIAVIILRIWINRSEKDELSDLEIVYTFIALFCIGGTVNIAIAIRYYFLAVYLTPVMHLMTNRYKKRAILSISGVQLDLVNITAFIYFLSLVVFQYSYFKLGI